MALQASCNSTPKVSLHFRQFLHIWFQALHTCVGKRDSESSLGRITFSIAAVGWLFIQLLPFAIPHLQSVSGDQSVQLMATSSLLCAAYAF